MAFTVMPLEVLSCTSWMVFSDFTGNGTNILHKNRDSASRKVFISSNQPGAARRWIALGSGGANIGFNSSGLAGAMNSGEKTPDAPNAKDKKSTPALLLEILNSCDTAAQAVKKLEKQRNINLPRLLKVAGGFFVFFVKSQYLVCTFS